MKIKLSQAFDLQMGKTPARNNAAYWNGSKKWVSIADIGNSGKYIADTKECITDKGVRESGIKAVPKETVIMSFKLSIGKTAITAEELYTNEAIMAFIDKGIYAIDPTYFYHLCCGKNWTAGTNKAVMGLTLNKATISGIEINIPDIAEQRKIAARLDCLDTVIADRQLQLEYLDQLVKSRFIELFGDPVINPKGFPCYTVGEVIDFQGGSQPDKKYFEYEPSPDNIRLIQIRDYKSDKYITYIPKTMAKRFCTADDIMIGRYGPPIFQILKGIEGSFNVALMKATPKMGNREFVRQFLKQDCLLKYLEGLSKRTAGQDGIQMDKLKAYPFPYPPIEMQDQFAAFVEQTDKSKLAVQKSLEELEILKKSLMQQYFG